MSGVLAKGSLLDFTTEMAYHSDFLPWIIFNNEEMQDKERQ